MQYTPLKRACLIHTDLSDQRGVQSLLAWLFQKASEKFREIYIQGEKARRATVKRSGKAVTPPHGLSRPGPSCEKRTPGRVQKSSRPLQLQRQFGPSTFCHVSGPPSRAERKKLRSRRGLLRKHVCHRCRKFCARGIANLLQLKTRCAAMHRTASKQRSCGFRFVDCGSART